MNRAELVALIGPVIVYVVKALSDRQTDRQAERAAAAAGRYGGRAPRPRRSYDNDEDGGI